MEINNRRFPGNSIGVLSVQRYTSAAEVTAWKDALVQKFRPGLETERDYSVRTVSLLAKRFLYKD